MSVRRSAEARPSSRWLSTLEGALLLVAALSLGYVAVAQTAAAREQAALSLELEALSATRATSGGNNADGSGAAQGSGASAPVRPPAAPAHGSLIGRIEIPRLGLSAVAREGSDQKTLRTAVGHVAETALPGQQGNAAFAGHRDTFFRKLEGIRNGDRIVVTTPGGRYEYVVDRTRIVSPTELSVLDPTAEPTLTLITCHPFSYIGSAPNRFIVHALLSKQAD